MTDLITSLSDNWFLILIGICVLILGVGWTLVGISNSRKPKPKSLFSSIAGMEEKLQDYNIDKNESEDESETKSDEKPKNNTFDPPPMGGKTHD